jgi:hypothetical protein
MRWGIVEQQVGVTGGTSDNEGAIIINILLIFLNFFN